MKLATERLLGVFSTTCVSDIDSQPVVEGDEETPASRALA